MKINLEQIRSFAAEAGIIDATPTSGLVRPSQGDLPDFPIDCLPDPARRITETLAARLGVPASLPGSVLVGTYSGLSGHGLALKGSRNIEVFPNLFVLINARSGTGKSLTMEAVLRPVANYERRLLRGFDEIIEPGLRADLDRIEAALKRLINSVSNAEGADASQRRRDLYAERKIIQKKLVAPCILVEDVTTEALARTLAEQNEFAFSWSADARQLVRNLQGRYAPNGKSDFDFYLKAWSGDSHRRTRSKEGHTRLNHPLLAALWSAQPGILGELYSDEEFIGSGMLPRILYCETGARAVYTEPGAGLLDDDLSAAHAERIAAILDAYRNKETQIVGLTEEAFDLLDNYLREIIARRNSDLLDVDEFPARWAEQANRISLVIHLMRHGPEAHLHPVTATDAQAGIELMNFFAAHQIRALSSFRSGRQQAVFNRVIEAMPDFPDGLTPRDATRRGLFVDSQEARIKLDIMVDRELLRAENVQNPNGGPRSRRYFRTSVKSTVAATLHTNPPPKNEHRKIAL